LGRSKITPGAIVTNPDKSWKAPGNKTNPIAGGVTEKMDSTKKHSDRLLFHCRKGQENEKSNCQAEDENANFNDQLSIRKATVFLTLAL
jgi:hypothetical protein